MRRMLPALLLSAALLCSAPGESTSASQSVSSQPEGSQSSSSAQGGGTIRVQTDWSVLEGGEETLPMVWNRWYDSYTDHLISRKGYGTLLPYAGARVTIQPMEGESQDYLSTSFLYGLMTQEGTVVMDPVCTSIYRVSCWPRRRAKRSRSGAGQSWALTMQARCPGSPGTPTPPSSGPGTGSSWAAMEQTEMWPGSWTP